VGFFTLHVTIITSAAAANDNSSLLKPAETERDGDTEKRYQKPAVQQKTTEARIHSRFHDPE